MTVQALAASLPTSGFYRIRSFNSQRYITVIDDYGTLDITGRKADLGALRTFPNIDRQVSNLASVIYMKYEGDDRFDLQGQGTGARAIVGYSLQVKANADDTYWAYASKAGVSLYLYEMLDDFSPSPAFGEFGRLETRELKATNKSFKFEIIPLSSTNEDNYFGVRPDINVGNIWYKSLYSGFAFSRASQGMNVYYVSKIDKNRAMAVYSEITGTVPQATPVFVKCASEQPSANRLEFNIQSPEAISDNQLTGVYFCNTPNEASSPNHQRFVLYDASTMRVLGKTSNGELGFVKAPDSSLFIENGKKYLPSNIAYLKVTSDTPSELKLVTQEEYDKPVEVTITARSYTRAYGDANPVFAYDATASFNGQPELKCEATATSPVGTYPITVSQGSVTGANVIGVAGTLTITAAPLTITARSYTIDETEPVPTFEATYSGWKNQETETVLTKKPTFTCNVPADKTPGTYTITPAGAEAQNYAISYVNGTLTVTAMPTITVRAKAATMVYGDAVPTLEYTVEGGTLTGQPVLKCEATSKSNAGEYAITVEKGTITYPRLKLEGAKLTVTKAPLTVTAKSYTIVETEALPTFEATYSGWKNQETESVLTKKPTLTCNVPADKKPGTYSIVPAGAEAQNYAFNYVNGTLTITEAPTITVKAKAATMVYGDVVPTLEYTVEGGILTGQPVLKCEATSKSNAGEYAITVEKGTITYPRLKLEGAKLTVTKAPLTITAKSYTIVETAALPTFEATYSGWKNQETEAVLTKKPTLTSNAPADKAPGTYTITPAGAEAVNYSFTYANGTLTITEAPTITVKAKAATMVYGDAVPTLEYTVEGGTLTGQPVLKCEAASTSNVGEYAITVEKGTITYPRLKLEGAKLTITQAPLTASAGTYTMKQNEPRPPFKATYSGWKNQDTEAVLTKQPTFTTDAPADNKPGEYKVTISGAEAKNYSITYVEGKLIISSADAVTVVVRDTTMVYGDQVPAFKYIISDSSVMGAPVITCEATSASDVGNYVIKIEKGTLDYPNLNFVNGTLTVTKAPLTVEAEDAERVYGDENPLFKVSYSGWKNQDTEAVLTKQPVASTTAEKASGVGTYDIVVSGAEAQNYSFTYVNGTLTVTKALLTVKAEDATREEGQPNPEFVLTYSGWKNNDDVKALAKQPIATTMADENSAPGEYAITVSGGEASNYDFDYIDGTLTVTAKPVIIITVDDVANDNISTYQVKDDGTVVFLSAEPDDEGDTVTKVEIPETVTGEDGTEYPVTEIAAGALQGMASLLTVIIPETVQTIGADALAGCILLDEIFVYMPTPIDLTQMAPARGQNESANAGDDPVFSGVNKETCVLYVPDGTKADYEAAPVWSTFKHIVEMRYQGIASVAAQTAAQDDVYSLSGQKMTGRTLTKGVYIIGGRKVVVK